MVRIGLIVVLGMLALLTPVMKGQLTSASRATLAFQVDSTPGTWKCSYSSNTSNTCSLIPQR
jgi:hypothetical protein